MAGSKTDQPMCLMCLDQPAAATLDPCQHSYCSLCMDKHEEAQKKIGETSPCPTCQKQTPPRRPSLGRDTTVFDSDADDSTSNAEAARQEIGTNVGNAAGDLCKTCSLADRQTQAMNICWDCLSLPLCEECTLVHGESKATKDHIIISCVSFKIESLLCELHDEPIRSFCCSCGMSVCAVCVLLEHADHETKDLGEVYRATMADVEAETQEVGERMDGLTSDLKELEENRAAAIEMEDQLIQGVEGHAEECIEKILKSKDTLKKLIKKDFNVTWDMTKRLETIQLLITEIDDLLQKAKEPLDKLDSLPKYVEELLKVKDQLPRLRQMGKQDHEKRMTAYRNTFERIKKKPITFYPKTLKLDIGGLEKVDPEKLKRICDENGFCMCETCGRIPKPDQSRKGECDKMGSCRCTVCDLNIPKARPNRKHECERQGSCTCKVCDLNIPKASANNRYICDIQGSCTCKVCGGIIPKAGANRRYECERQGSCTCKVCGGIIPKASANREHECERQGSCTCNNCAKTIRHPNPIRYHECRGLCSCRTCGRRLYSSGKDCRRSMICKCSSCGQEISQKLCEGVGRRSCPCGNCQSRVECRCAVLFLLFLFMLIAILLMYLFSYFADYPMCSPVEKYRLITFDEETKKANHYGPIPSNLFFTFCIQGLITYIVFKANLAI